MRTSNQIGDYVLLQELGPGSLGCAYLAEHVFLKRKVIVKVLPEELASDPELTTRFEKHLSLLSRLNHPHIAKIHDATCVEGQFLIVSDAVCSADGQLLNLGQYFSQKQGEFSEEEILRIARQIASALDYAHQISPNLYHGLLKLNNLAVVQDKEGIQVVLTDFGLSHILGPRVMFSRTLSHVIQALGEKGAPVDLGKLRTSFCQNFAFLAPEQKVHVEQTHPKADVYAFGVLLYYLLLGEFPEGYFDLPSKRLGELKWNFDFLICKCLQTDPQKRPDHLSSKLDELLSTASQGARQQLLKLKAVAEDKAVPKPVLRPAEISRPAFDADPGAIFQTESSVSTYRPKIKEQKEIEPLLSDMVVIPAGTYLRGSNHGARDEMPRHAIHLLPFAIDTHPVTNEQFVLFLEVMGGEKDVNNNDIIRLRESRIKRSGGTLNIESGYAKHPVVGVTWYGAVAYTKWVGKLF